MKKYNHYLILFLILLAPNTIWCFYEHLNGSGFNLSDFIIVSLLSTLPWFSCSMILMSVLPNKATMVMVSSAAYILTFLCWIGVAHFILYGHVINGGSIYIALNSNVGEASEFLSMYGSVKIFVYFAGLMLAETLLIIIMHRKINKFSSNKKLGLLLGVVLLPFAFLVLSGKVYAGTDDNLFNVYANALWSYKLEEMKLNKMRQKAASQKIYITDRIRINKDTRETYLLVLGESISRRHMSLYGYCRDTNPLLGSLSAEIIKFDDVISADMNTNGSLKMLLTFANNEDMSKLCKPHLLHIMKTAGFKTYWLSNQKAFGPGELWSDYFSETADVRIFTNTDTFADSHDEKLLVPLKRILGEKEQKKFIVMHLMGAHLDAKKRYPPEFRHYTHESNMDWIMKNKRSPKTYDYIDVYDDAIRHDDYIIFNIIKILKGAGGIGMMLYVPDHGEEVGEIDDFIGRCYRTSRYMYEIPMIAWMSPEYVLFRRDTYLRARDAVHRPYQTDDLIHTYMDLAGVWSDGFEPERSILNDHFRPRKRNLQFGLQKRDSAGRKENGCSHIR